MTRAVHCNHQESQDLPCLGQAHAGSWKSHISLEGGVQQAPDLSPGCAKPQLCRHAGREQCCWQRPTRLCEVQAQKPSAAPAVRPCKPGHPPRAAMPFQLQCAKLAVTSIKAGIITLEVGQAVSLCGQMQPTSSVPDLCLHHQANTYPTTKPGLKHQPNPAQVGYSPLQPQIQQALGAGCFAAPGQGTTSLQPRRAVLTDEDGKVIVSGRFH